MAQPYVGEIRMFAGNFAPAGWAFCDGQLVPISEYETLFQLIGTTYGGDGQSTFAMPDMRSRIPIHQGSGFVLSETGGVEQVTLTVAQIPMHTHAPTADANSGTSATLAGGHTWANSGAAAAYSTDPDGPMMAANAVASTGGSQPHSNLQPFLCVDFIISLYGIFPSPT